MGAFAARMDDDITSRWVLDKPNDVDDLTAEAGAMRRCGTTTHLAIDGFEVRLKKAGITERVPWVIHWLPAVVHHNTDQFDEAAEHYAAAFQLGRYNAGDLRHAVPSFCEPWRRCPNLVARYSVSLMPIRRYSPVASG